jgi:hypothetical protein
MPLPLRLLPAPRAAQGVSPSAQTRHARNARPANTLPHQLPLAAQLVTLEKLRQPEPLFALRIANKVQIFLITLHKALTEVSARCAISFFVNEILTDCS